MKLEDMELHPEDMGKVVPITKPLTSVTDLDNLPTVGTYRVSKEVADIFNNDPVNHPKHYNSYNDIEIIQLIEQLNFNRGSAIKYISRAGLKAVETEIQDLEKAEFHIRREIERLKINAKREN